MKRGLAFRALEADHIKIIANPVFLPLLKGRFFLGKGRLLAFPDQFMPKTLRFCHLIFCHPCIILLGVYSILHHILIADTDAPAKEPEIFTRISRLYRQPFQHAVKKRIQLCIILIHFYAPDHPPFPKCIQHQVQYILYLCMILDVYYCFFINWNIYNIGNNLAAFKIKE